MSGYCEERVFFMKIFDRIILREKNFGLTYGYVNPWVAAIDNLIDHNGVTAKPRESRPQKRVQPAKENRPTIRL